MNLIATQYAEINGIGILLLLMMLFYSCRMRQENDSEGQRLFMLMLICNACVLFSDAIIFIVSGYVSPMLELINQTSCLVYFSLHAPFGYFWFQYCVNRLYPERTQKKWEKTLLLLPCMISEVLILFSPWEGWVYSLTNGNRYTRGALMWLLILLSYSYLAASFLLVLTELFRQRRNVESSVYLTLLLFPIPTVFANIVQLRHYGLSVVWVCSALSLLIIFVDIQNKQLSRDALTGLFNRRQADKQIAWEADHLSRGSALYVIMCDIDNFKGINDRFGHLVGDQALINISGIFRRSVSKGTFIGRLGGDEFVIVGHDENKAAANALVQRVQQEVAAFNQKQTAPYEISISTGFAVFESGEQLSVERIVSAADRAMYRNKAEKKARLRL